MLGRAGVVDGGDLVIEKQALKDVRAGVGKKNVVARG